jgi:3-deoxy-manno-octulosonate cytidylyltransferase (CMP-KDO synthetase)
VVIAIDSDETYQKLKKYDYELVMTSASHVSGTDRIAEVVENIKGISDEDIIINIQADEPFIDPILIDKLINEHNTSNIPMSTIVSTSISKLDYKDESVVKALLDRHDYAVDFMRKGESLYKHLGVYGYTKKTLSKFINLKQSIEEKNRNLEQMRALENNIKIKAIITDKDWISINTYKDLTEARLRKDVIDD